MEKLKIIYERLLIEFKSYKSVTKLSLQEAHSKEVTLYPSYGSISKKTTTELRHFCDILQIDIGQLCFDLTFIDDTLILCYNYDIDCTPDIMKLKKDDDIELLFMYLKNVDSWD